MLKLTLTSLSFSDPTSQPPMQHKDLILQRPISKNPRECKLAPAHWPSTQAFRLPIRLPCLHSQPCPWQLGHSPPLTTCTKGMMGRWTQCQQMVCRTRWTKAKTQPATNMEDAVWSAARTTQEIWVAQRLSQGTHRRTAAWGEDKSAARWGCTAG